MRRMAIAAGVAVLSILAGEMFGVADETKPDDAARTPAGQGPSLMEMLGEWTYPGATWIGGAKVADGGNPELPSVKCETVLVTPDSFEEVTKFYAEKLNVDAKEEIDGEGKPAADAGKTVAVINDSLFDENDDRPVKLQVITVHDRDSSTTLVISRANEERETHIAWSHWVRGDGGK